MKKSLIFLVGAAAVLSIIYSQTIKTGQEKAAAEAELARLK